MTPLANHMIAMAEWRAGYVALGLPILLIVAPLIFFLVRPGSTERKETAPPTLLMSRRHSRLRSGFPVST
jgi:hypothetical protein